MDIQIRQANADDLPAIHQLVRELAIYEKAEDAFTATLEDYQNDFRDGIFESLVATVDGQVVGMMLYYMSYSTWKGRMLYLEDFVVNEAFRQMGIGQKLWEQFLEIARQKGCRLVKWQVLDWNLPAINFYVKNKAIIEREWWNGKIFLVQ
ncbi:MAG: GNAT family N-acetyltransferase [Bacteroidetes bacterium]|nr:MAG: GNAT family N-acetyltransferase [Bacteroidota bacterium]